MNPGTAIAEGFKGYFHFSGRSSRSAYWWWWLFSLIVTFVAGFLDLYLGTPTSGDRPNSSLGTLSTICVLLLFIPGLAVTIRRLHDSGLSGWWVLIAPIPFAGLILIVLLLRGSTPGPNRYGLPALSKSELMSTAQWEGSAWESRQHPPSGLAPRQDEFPF
jgi:uncharacterized membrane protein YhaH (DUF805 family)